MGEQDDFAAWSSADLLSAFEDAVGLDTYPGRASRIELMRIQLQRRLERASEELPLAIGLKEVVETLVGQDPHVDRGPGVRRLVEFACAPVRADSSADLDSGAVSALIQLVRSGGG